MHHIKVVSENDRKRFNFWAWSKNFHFRLLVESSQMKGLMGNSFGTTDLIAVKGGIIFLQLVPKTLYITSVLML